MIGTGRKACVRYGPGDYWWAHQDLNLGPKDSGLNSFAALKAEQLISLKALILNYKRIKHT